MKELPTPHNNFFQFALSQLPNARSLIETQLSQASLAKLKLDTLQVETGSFVDPDLRGKFSDLLFSVQQVTDGDRNDQALIYFLFEHKSQNDPLTVLQLLSYVVRIWEKRVRDGRELCPIVPLIVYHGESGWTAAKDLGELVQTPPELLDYSVQFAPPLLDLSQLDDDQIEGEPILRSTLRLLKYSRSKHLIEQLSSILDLVSQSVPERILAEWIEAIGVYVMTVNKNIDREQYNETLASILPTKYEPGSLADRLLTQGREEGLEEGIEKGVLAGRIQLLEEMLGDDVSPLNGLKAMNEQQLQSRLEELRKRMGSRKT